MRTFAYLALRLAPLPTRTVRAGTLPEPFPEFDALPKQVSGFRAGFGYNNFGSVILTNEESKVGDIRDAVVFRRTAL